MGKREFSKVALRRLRHENLEAREMLTADSVLAESVDSDGSALFESMLSEAISTGGLVFSEINYNPTDPSTPAELAISGIDNDDFEFIELFNPSTTETINLLGVQITEGVSYTFGDVDLLPGERAVVVENQAAFEARYGTSIQVVGEWSGGLSNGGERVTLLDSGGEELMSVNYDDSDPWSVAADGAGATLVLINPSSTPANELGKYYSWRTSTQFNGTPGTASFAVNGVVINEILAHTDLPQSDSIELFNPTNSTIDISGWYLSDSGNNLLKFEIPANTQLLAGQYLTFDENDFNPTPFNPGANDFALSAAEGDEVYLTIPNISGTAVESFVDALEFGASFNGVSFGRVPNGVGRLTPMTSVTLGAENSTPQIGPLVISEVNYHPEDPFNATLAIDPTITEDDLEFIEIHNPTLTAVDLTDWRLRGGSEFDFASGESLAAGETLVVVSFDPDDPTNASRLAAFISQYGISSGVRFEGPLTDNLSNSFDRVELERHDDPPFGQPNLIPQVTADEVLYDDLAQWPLTADGDGDSLNRNSPGAYGNDAASWSAATPTPGSVNFATPLPGDYDSDGDVDSDDYSVWVANYHSVTNLDADGNSDGIVDAADYTIWRDNLGAQSVQVSTATTSALSEVETTELEEASSAPEALATPASDVVTENDESQPALVAAATQSAQEPVSSLNDSDTPIESYSNQEQLLELTERAPHLSASILVGSSIDSPLQSHQQLGHQRQSRSHANAPSFDRAFVDFERSAGLLLEKPIQELTRDVMFSGLRSDVRWDQESVGFATQESVSDDEELLEDEFSEEAFELLFYGA